MCQDSGRLLCVCLATPHVCTSVSTTASTATDSGEARDGAPMKTHL